MLVPLLPLLLPGASCTDVVPVSPALWDGMPLPAVECGADPGEEGVGGERLEPVKGIRCGYLQRLKSLK